MAMKLGGEYSSERISPKHFERLAEEAGLAKPMTKRRGVELAEIILSTLPTVTTDHSVTASVAKLLQSRCDRAVKSFRS
jgi:serine/threonine-protein kinase HipA